MAITIGRIILKLVTCAIGGCLVGFGCGALMPGDYPPEYIQIGGIFFGTYCGICWSINHEKAKSAFMLWTILPSIIGLTLGITLDNEGVAAWVICAGFFLGIVRGLSKVGAYK